MGARLPRYEFVPRKRLAIGCPDLPAWWPGQLNTLVFEQALSQTNSVIKPRRWLTCGAEVFEQPRTAVISRHVRPWERSTSTLGGISALARCWPAVCHFCAHRARGRGIIKERKRKPPFSGGLCTTRALIDFPLCSHNSVVQRTKSLFSNFRDAGHGAAEQLLNASVVSNK